MEHAFGLYTHIRSNKRRSVALLIGLFFLVYVMVYAGALIAEVLTGDAPLDGPEIEAVLGHELTHIRNGDVRLLVIAVVIAGVIAFFAELVVRMFFQSGLYWRGRR